MTVHTNEFYHAAIKTAYPDSWNLRVPPVLGTVCPVFFCDTPTGTRVCRFSDYDIVFRNRRISHLMSLYDIPVPQTQVHAYLDTWFESYDYCASPTFYECSVAGMSDADIFNVYKRATDIQHKIADVPLADFNPGRRKYMYEVFSATQKMRVHPVLAYVYGTVHRLFSTRGSVRVLHNDLNRKNILVDDNLDVPRILDLDAIALCNESFSVLMTLRTYPLTNISEYLDYYEDTMERKLNRPAIIGGLKILNAIRTPQVALNRVLWRGYNTPPTR